MEVPGSTQPGAERSYPLGDAITAAHPALCRATEAGRPVPTAPLTSVRVRAPVEQAHQLFHQVDVLDIRLNVAAPSLHVGRIVRL